MAGRHMVNASTASLSGDERAEVGLRGASGWAAGELTEDVGTDLVTVAANRRAEMDAEL